MASLFLNKRKLKSILIFASILAMITLVRSQLEIPDDDILDIENKETSNPIPLQEDSIHPSSISEIDLIINKEAEKEYIPHHPGRQPSYTHKDDSVKMQREEEEVERQPESKQRQDYRQLNLDLEEDSMMHDGAQMNSRMNKGNKGGFQGGMPGRQVGNMGSHNTGNNNIKNMQQSYSNNNNSPSAWFGGIYGSIYEILMLIFLFGFIFNCFCGKNLNDKYAMAWYAANKQYFEERYEVIGRNNQESDQLEFKMPENAPIIKESPYYFKFFCANYRYVKWLIVVLEFRKRTDSVSLFTSFFLSNKDRIVYEVAINPAEEVGWLFCVCKKRDAKNLKSTYSDIGFFTNNYDPSIINDRLTVLSENIELFIELFQNKNLLNYYKSVEPFVDVIYYTDQQAFCKDKFALFFSFELHLNVKIGIERTLLEITHFVNLFSDTLAQLKFSEKIKKEFDKNRVMFERTKMEEFKRKEIEDQEKKDFIENWKIRNKMKGKKPQQKKFKDLKAK